MFKNLNLNQNHRETLRFSLFRHPTYYIRDKTYERLRTKLSTLFMQNKPNFRKAKMNVNSLITMDYENKFNWTIGQNKPNSNPIKPNLVRRRRIPERPKSLARKSGHTHNHYAIEFAFKKAMNLNTMAVSHFAISACK